MSYILQAVKQAEHDREDSRLLREETARNQQANQPSKSKPWLAIAVFLNAVVLLLWLVFKVMSDPSFFSFKNDADNLKKSKETVTQPAGAKPSFLASSEAKQEVDVTQNKPVKKNSATKPVIKNVKPENTARIKPKATVVEPKPKIVLPIEEVAKEKIDLNQTKKEPAIVAKVDPLPEDPTNVVEEPGRESIQNTVQEDKPVEQIAIPENIEVPSLGELPYSLQKQIPKLRISVHVYNPRKEARKVKINSRLYFQGDNIEDDLIVEEITAHGVVFNYSGTLFKLNLH